MSQFGIIAIFSIIISSGTVFVYTQDETREQIRSQLLEEQKQRQIESTSKVASHVGSDLTLISAILDGLSDSKYLQDGNLYNREVKSLAEDKYSSMSDIVDNLFILNSNDIVTVRVGNSTNSLAPLGNDLSFRPWVKETRDNLQPVFSEGFEALGEYRVFITSPIIQRETGKYIGLVGASVPTVKFFQHYGNVHDVNSQFLVAFDKNGGLLAVGASQDLVGLDYFGDEVQEFLNHNPTLNDHTAKMLGGESGYALYDYGRGERLTTYQPLQIAGQQEYFLQVVTPTDTIYAEIEPIISRENGKLILLLAGSIAASAVLVIFLIYWNSSLRREVKNRTAQLETSNKLLAETNQELKLRDNMQKEFINIAAHEIRTPIQPILGMSDMAREKIVEMSKHMWFLKNNQVTEPIVSDVETMLDVINRNAKRLDKLSSDLLDISRIENKSLRLNKEKIDLNEKIINAVIDARSIARNNNELEIIYEPSQEPLIVEADKLRIFQVISNMVRNAMKFTAKGKIIINCERRDGHAVVSVRDTGTGIDPEMIPRLFTKFATKSEKGIGLGLFLSKNIVEAHGGRIWAQNNSDKGATFTFALPLNESDLQ